MEAIANILIVDDIADNLKVLGDVLRSEGYKVRPVPSGKLALQVAEKEKPDLILLDIMMPEMNGFEVCQRLKADANLADVPVIFISALNDTEDIVKAFSSGGADYITKPFMAEEVKARVATHLKIYLQNKELQKLNANKDRFITILAHDLRSPFVGILNFSELLASNVRKYDIDKIESYLKLIHKSSQHFYLLLEELLLWARAQTGNVPFNPQKIQLKILSEEIIDVLSLSAENKNITISENLSRSVEVFADREMVKTVIRNLVSNAIKFTPEDGSITIAAQRTQSMVTISVSDTGVGISEKNIKKLFDVTEIYSTRGTNDETGTGFGLLLCKEFIEKQGGKIWVESQEGIGTTFFFTLHEDEL